VGAHHHAVAIEIDALLLVGAADDLEPQATATQGGDALAGGDLQGVHGGSGKAITATTS
jgi:hypothetical protein